jgi:hypothetical protein
MGPMGRISPGGNSGCKPFTESAISRPDLFKQKCQALPLVLRVIMIRLWKVKNAPNAPKYSHFLALGLDQVAQKVEALLKLDHGAENA